MALQSIATSQPPVIEESKIDSATSESAVVKVARLEDFYISENTGFLVEQPLTELPPYFKAWNDVGQQLSVLVKAHTLRKVVDKVKLACTIMKYGTTSMAFSQQGQLPQREIRDLMNAGELETRDIMSLLDHQQLSGQRQWRLAYTILSLMGQGYVWQDGVAGVAKKLPRQLAIPWFGVATRLGMKPSLCHASAVLSNWQLIDSSGSLTIDNVRQIFELSDDVNYRGFYSILIISEKEVVPGLKAILKAKESILSDDVDSVRQSLESVADNITHLKSIMASIHEKVGSDAFYNVILPFLFGWGGSGSALPDGLLFEGVSDVPISVVMGTAAQSSIIPCFDAALGVTQEPDKQQFFDTMRTYMPPAHARFIDELRAAPSIREYVVGCKDKALVESYQRSVGALRDFRSYHIQITTKYLVSKAKSVKGSSGTELMPFLKDIRDATAAAATLDSVVLP